MDTLYGLNELRGLSVHAADGYIGKVRETLLDDQSWLVRYVVVDVGHWVHPRLVLLAPQALGEPLWAAHTIPAGVTMRQVRSSPDLGTDMPVALQRQAELHRHYGWEAYWAGDVLAASGVPGAFDTAARANKGGKPLDPHLRTTEVLTGLLVEATDGAMGRVADLLFDMVAWAVGSIAVTTPEHGRVLIDPHRVRAVDITAGRLLVGGSRTDVLAASASMDTAALAQVGN